MGETHTAGRLLRKGGVMRITLSGVNFRQVKMEVGRLMVRTGMKAFTDKQVLVSGRSLMEEELKHTQNPWSVEFVPSLRVSSVITAETEVLPERQDQDEPRVRRFVRYYLRDIFSEAMDVDAHAALFLLIDVSETYKESELGQYSSFNLRHLMRYRPNPLEVDKPTHSSDTVEAFVRHVEILSGESFFPGDNPAAVCQAFKTGFLRVDRLLNGWAKLKQEVGLTGVCDFSWVSQSLAAMPLHRLFRAWCQHMACDLVGDPFQPTNATD